MTAVRDVLVIGAGLAGTACAIQLARAGVRVDLVDRQADVSALGSGITLQGNALRALRELGVWEEVKEHGYAYDSLGLRAPDPSGTLVAEMTEIRSGGDDLPATAGMYRPELARILVDRAVEVGAGCRFGVTPRTLNQDAEGVEVELSDGSRRRYDLVIGADGVRSWTRQAVGIQVDTTPTGMGIWRAFVPRPESVTRTDLFYGGPSYIAGYCPTGPDTLYAYIVEKAQDRSGLGPQEGRAIMRDLAAAYHGPWDEIRGSLENAESVNYTWFETHVLPAPWNRGRVVVIGDAAHVCPPTLAQGGAQALEDALVLTELLLAADALDDRLWTAFAARRIPRASAVVEASLQLGRWLQDGVRGDVPGLMHDVMTLVRETP
ncbi:FAD-dependent oxidoreductase [Nakamurella sp.]|uniref:FAD-dependent oxidoreductase n=1 Tax=Nakamurella sp. TaxID=1869182 RepID=UPI003B3ADAE2